MPTRISVARIAGAILLLCAAAAPLGAQDSPKPSPPPVPKDARPQQGTGAPATGQLPPKAPAPFRPGEDVSPGSKVSFPNDI
jgi:hypothetical protein